jgi:hypothetical protein
MIIYIPGELVSLLTFPGVIIHEIAHRLLCDIQNIPVYDVRYFIVWSRRAGYVIHARTDHYRKRLLIGLEHFFVNSLVAMVCTIPLATELYFGTTFAAHTCLFLPKLVITWIGVSVGFNAIPSKKDTEGLLDECPNFFLWCFLAPLISFFYICNLDGCGWIFGLMYTAGISCIIPALLA